MFKMGEMVQTVSQNLTRLHQLIHEKNNTIKEKNVVINKCCGLIN